MQQPSLNEQIARLLEQSEYRPIPANYAEDLNAAVEACLTLGYMPCVDPYETTISKGLMIDIWSGQEVNNTPATIITDNMTPQEITKLVALTLCEALVEAESEAENGE